MKLTKRFLAVLLAVLLAALLAVPGMASGTATYTPVTFNLSTLGLSETLTVTYPGRTSPAVTYTLTLGEALPYEDDLSVYSPSEDTLTVLGNLSGEELGTVTFSEGAATYETPAEGTYTANLDTLAAINLVQFDRPCIVFLPIIKSIDCDDPQVSNNNVSDTALVIVVEDSEGTLSPSIHFKKLDANNNDLPTGDKVQDFNDQYPNTQTLTLTKNVTGNMGQKDRYFRFTVRLTWGEAADDDLGVVLTPTGANTVNTATPKYDEDFDDGFDNLAPVTIGLSSVVTGYPVAEFQFWLKDGEKVEIPNLPYGAAWEIWEDDDSRGDYRTTSVATDDGDDPITGNENIRSDGGPIVGDQADVVFTNTLQTSPPTGLTLQTAAPIAGAVLALGLGAVLLLGKKRRKNGAV